MLRSFHGTAPTIADSAYITETAVIIGDVHIGESSSVWFNTVIRGDVNHIRIGDRTNIQDLSVLHVSGRKNAHIHGKPLFIGNDVTIGHSATIHGCIIENGAFIGMKAMVMDGAIIGTGAMIAAGSLVTEGTNVPPFTLWLGSPAKFKRYLTEQEKLKTAASALSYVTLARTYKEASHPVSVTDSSS